jgi:hypothetical protein
VSVHSEDIEYQYDGRRMLGDRRAWKSMLDLFGEVF